MIYWKVAFIHFERTSCMERNLTTGSIGKAVLVFSVPYLITYFLQMFYGMADLFIVGQYNGVDEITAVAVGSQIMHMATVMLVGLAMGTTVCIARAVGAGDKERIAQAVGNTSILFFGVSLAATILTLLFLDSIVSLMATPAAAVPGTTSYLFICFLGIPFITAYNVISAMFRGLGDTKSPLYFVAVACILNIALDYFFIGGMGLGAKGAAYATVLAQASSVLFSLIYIRLRNTGITLKLSCLRPNHAVFRELLRVGVPICMQDAFIQITFIILTIIANSRGLEQAAAVGIVEKLLGFFFLVPSSMLSAVSALAAQNLGAGKPDRARGTLNYALGIVITYGLAVGVLMQFFSPHVLSKFTTDAAVIAMGCDYMGAYIWDVTLGGIQFCYSGYFCAYGISIAAFIHNAVSSVTVRVPGAYLAVILWPETLMPMGAAAPIGSLLSIIICLFIIRWMKRHPEKLPGFPKVKEESP